MIERCRLRCLTFVAVLLISASAAAEQKQRLGDFDVHYVLVPSTFFSTAIAERYDIVRGRDRALLNISVLDQQLKPRRVVIEGEITNLLGQRQPLEFTEVVEPGAAYYLAPVRFSDRETLRFTVRFTVAQDIVRTLEFQQQMFWSDR